MSDLQNKKKFNQAAISSDQRLADHTYWRKQLEGIQFNSILLPNYIRSGPDQGKRAEVEFQFSEAVIARIKKIAGSADLSLYIVLIAGLKLLLHKYTGSEDICIGSPVYQPNGGGEHWIPLRSQVSGNKAGKEILQSIRTTILEAYAHQQTRVEGLTDVPEVFTFLRQIHLKKEGCGRLIFEFVSDGNKLGGRLAYDSELFLESAVKQLADHYVYLMGQFLENLHLPISQITMISFEERNHLLNSFRGKSCLFPVKKTLHELFEQQAALSPEGIAAIYSGTQITYAELNEKANKIARLLRQIGLKRNDFVGILEERGLNFLAAILGILKAGAAFVPIDHNYPPKRVGYMLTDSEVRTLITSAPLAEKFALESAGGALQFLLYTDCNIQPRQHSEQPAGIKYYGASDIASQKTADLACINEPGDLAYMLYTSGSTGMPKGAMVQHKGAINHIYAKFDQLPFHSRTAFMQSAPASSDVSVWQFLAPLLVGGRTVIVDLETVCDPARLFPAVQSEGMTAIELVPSVFKELVEYVAQLAPNRRELPALEWAMVTGETVPVSLVNRWLEIYPGIKLVNAYGPTEASDDVCQFIMQAPLPTRMQSVPIGKPLANLRLYILSQELLLNAMGVPGEICVSGIGVGTGYWNKPDKTASNFVPNPYAEGENDGMLYRTGDLGRWLPDGNLEFLGRLDCQVKIHGVRIELGEIEALLEQHPAVRQCIVLAREDEPGRKQLVGYTVTKEGVGVTSNELRTHLESRLPPSMIPSAFVSLKSLPLTPNGKIDRNAFPRPDRSLLISGYVEPQNDVEKTIAAIWQELLHLERVGVHDNFFELGGNSILVVQMQSRLQELLQRKIAVVELFQFPTIHSLARHLSGQNTKVVLSGQERANKQKSLYQDSIAVVGMAGRFPGARNVEEFWGNLRDGVESITFFSEAELMEAGVEEKLVKDERYVKAKGVVEGVEMFDAGFFGYSPREAEILDPQQRLFLEHAWEALEHAGYDAERYSGLIGVYAGTSMNRYLFNLLSDSQAMAAVNNLQILTSSDKDFLANRISYKLNLKGPSITVQTACSTSLVAIHMACKSLIAGECDLALAGGVALDLPQKNGYLYAEEGIMSPDGHCRAFDAKGKGTVGGSGVGVVVLKRLSEAVADGDTIYAVIKGSAVNNDGAGKVGYTAPSVAGQAEVIATAQALAGVSPESIGYVEAHGTGTALGDPIEISALTQSFKTGTTSKEFCAIGSLKSNVGHLDAAAGVAGLIKTVMALKHGQLPPSLHFEEPNPKIDFAASPFYVNTRLKEWKQNGSPRRAGVSSFGIGGTNAHVVLEESPPFLPSRSSRPYHLLIISAKTSNALDQATANLVACLKENEESCLADVAYTLQIGRKAFGRRRMVVCGERKDAVHALESMEGVFTAGKEPKERPVVFMFTGQGSQYEGMGRELYKHETVFREQVDKCSELLQAELNLDLRQVLYPEKESAAGLELLKQTALAQPALFVIEYALAKLWMSWGIEPQAMIGHSIGEYVAACLAGVFLLEDALKLVAARGRLMQELPNGVMLSVQLSDGETAMLLQEIRLQEHLDIAAVNGPALCVVSGATQFVEKLEAELKRRKLEFRRLHTSHAFHSGMMDPIVGRFVEFVKKVKLNVPAQPYISNLTGTWIAPIEATNPEYWGKHLRHTVRFSDGLKELLKRGEHVFLEIGPGQTLSTLVKGHLDQESGQVVLSSLRRQENQQSDILNVLGRLWLSGMKVDWPGFYALEQRRRVPLPTYPFERQRYWINRRNQPYGIPAARPAINKRSNISDWFSVPSWKQRPLTGQNWKSTLQKQQSCWLVFLDECGLSAKLVDELQQTSQRVITVKAGREFKKEKEAAFVLNVQSPEDYQQLLRELRSSRQLPDTIIHSWCLTRTESISSNDFCPEALDTGFYSLLFLMQAIGEYHYQRPVQIKVISNHVQDVMGDEYLSPAKAALLGPCQVASQEYPNIQCTSVDVVLPEANSQRERELVESLLQEVTHKSSERIIAHRHTRRWIQNFESIRLEKSAACTRLRDGGVYLISGGLGGIGLVLAEHIAKTVRAKLILLARTPLPARKEWEQWLATHPEQDSTAGKIRRVQSLEQLGAEVLTVNADVADLDQMRNVMKQIHEHFGPVQGIIHAAGIAGGGLIQLKTREQATSVLAPKVMGTQVLGELLAGTELDFYILCSSVNSFGGIGQVDYCAANAFLDAYARKHGKKNTISINWDTWQQVGMTVNTAVPSNLQKLRDQDLQFGIEPEEGKEVFSRILECSLPQVIVTPRDYFVGGEFLIQGNGNEVVSQDFSSKSMHERPELSSAYVAPRNQTEGLIAELWQELLGVGKVGIHDNFFELGGHSLMATQIISRIREMLRVELPLTALLGAATVAELVAYLVSKEVAPGQTEKIVQTIQRLRKMPKEERQRLLEKKRKEKALS